MKIWRDWLRKILSAALSVAFFILLGGRPGAHAGEIEVSVDRTTQAWSDLAMGPPSSDDDADQSQNAKAVFSYVPAYGKPHIDAGASGLILPRLNDGRFAANGDSFTSGNRRSPT